MFNRNKYKKYKTKSYLPVYIASIDFEGISEKGNVRAKNEDSIFIDKKGKYVLLADGVGGHQKGNVASRSTVNTIRSFITSKKIKKEIKNITFVEDIPKEVIGVNAIVEKAIGEANSKIYKKNKNLKNNLKGMATTIVGAVFIDGGYILWFHIGDSRIYRYRNSILGCLTVDHSEYTDWVVNQKFSSKKEPNRCIITKAIGIKENVVADISWEKIQNNDIYILCSDGINDVLDDCQISEIVSSSKDYKNISNQLISKAIDAGSRDNLSVIVCGIRYIYNY